MPSADSHDVDFTSEDARTNHDAAARLRHDLLSPLTTIRGHAQLMRRRVARLDGLTEAERALLTGRAAHIEAAVIAMVGIIARIGGQTIAPPAEAARSGQERDADSGRADQLRDELQ